MFWVNFHHPIKIPWLINYLLDLTNEKTGQTNTRDNNLMKY
jgi:hypothetical protein